MPDRIHLGESNGETGLFITVPGKDIDIATPDDYAFSSNWGKVAKIRQIGEFPIYSSGGSFFSEGSTGIIDKGDIPFVYGYVSDPNSDRVDIPRSQLLVYPVFFPTGNIFHAYTTITMKMTTSVLSVKAGRQNDPDIYDGWNFRYVVFDL